MALDCSGTRPVEPGAKPSLAGEYHDTDFAWDEARKEYRALLALLQLRDEGEIHIRSGQEERVNAETSGSTATGPISLEEKATKAVLTKDKCPSPWEAFHSQHATARFFKPRRYILHAFPMLTEPGLRILELGCGAGASLLPCLVANPECRAVGCDISHSSLDLLSRAARAACIASDRLAGYQHDLEGCDGSFLPVQIRGHTFDAVLLIFTLSALSDTGIWNAMHAAYAALRPGGWLLVRDYGLFDMVHLRFVVASGSAQAIFYRGDGTLARFFSLDWLEKAAQEAGMKAIEARYACTRLRRFNKPDKKRVFVNMVFEKSVDAVI